MVLELSITCEEGIKDILVGECILILMTIVTLAVAQHKIQVTNQQTNRAAVASSKKIANWNLWKITDWNLWTYKIRQGKLPDKMGKITDDAL